MQPFTKCVSIAVLLTGLAAVAACQRDHGERALESATDRDSAPPAPAGAAAPDGPPAAPEGPAAAADGRTAGAADQPPEGVLRAYVWECDDGATLTMKNLFRENAITLGLHEGPRRLNQVPSASGAKYADESLTFWTKGGTALFERKGKPAIKCHELRAQSILADARVRGVDYRGTGNEPGWLVEAGPGNRLLLVTNYGQERHEQANATIRKVTELDGVAYQADGADGTVTATFRRAPCIDDMSGQEFDHVVVVAFRGQELRGCGAGLQ